MIKKKKVLMLCGDNAGCAMARLWIPATGLNATNRFECKTTFILEPKIMSWKPEIVVFSRQHSANMLSFGMYWRESGVKIIYDIDDNLIETPQHIDIGGEMRKARKQLGQLMSLASVVTVSTKPLKELYSKLNPNIKVLPNCMLRDTLQLGLTNKNEDEIRLGWAGTETHSEDFKTIQNAFLQVANKYPKVKFVFFGFAPPQMIQALPKERLIYQHWCDVLNYHRTLGKLKLDLAVCPLVDSKFNSCKSNIKFLEYSACKIPTIASSVYPYSNTIIHNETGLIAKKNKHLEWVKHLSYLIENKSERIRLGTNAHKWVEDNLIIDNNIHLWESAYLDEN